MVGQIEKFQVVGEVHKNHKWKGDPLFSSSDILPGIFFMNFSFNIFESLPTGGGLSWKLCVDHLGDEKCTLIIRQIQNP